MADVSERRVTANGLGHHVVEWAPGAAHRGDVLLCHGFLDFAWGYVELAPRLAAAGYRVFSVDWRGHGETDWIGAGGYYHFPDYVLDLHALTPQLFGAPFHLVGHSMGGSACSLFAASHPQALRSLAVLEGLGPSHIPVEGAVQRTRLWVEGVDRIRSRQAPRLDSLEQALGRMRRRNASLPDRHAQFLAEKATRPHPDGDGLTWHFDPLHRTVAPVGFDVERFLQFTSRIEMATLVVQGTKGIVTADDERRVASLPNASKVLLQGADHMLQWSAPEQLADALLAFWDEAPSETR